MYETQLNSEFPPKKVEQLQVWSLDDFTDGGFGSLVSSIFRFIII